MNFTYLKKTSSAIHYDKNQETDSQMLIRIGKKFALLFFLIAMFDTLVDLFLGLFDLLIEAVHILIETIEYSIEMLLEYSFQMNHHQSEMIIVNGSFVIALYVIYRLYLAAPRCFSNLKSKYLSCIENNASCWHAIPLMRKIKLITIYCFGTGCILFTLTI